MPDAAPATLQLPLLTVRAAVSLSTVNADTRTVDVTFTTGAKVRRGGLFSDPFVEELSLAAGHVKLDRLTSGRAPVLAAHSADSLGDVIGVVDSASLSAKGGTATLRFAKDDVDADRAWKKIEQGILRNVSVGYVVHRFEETGIDARSALPIRRAVDWEPYEISIVPMGADPGALIRGDQPRRYACELIRTAQGAAIMEPVNAAVVSDSSALEPVEPTAHDAGVLAERKRCQGIQNGCEAARLPKSFADKLIADGVPLEAAQTRILDTLRSGAGDPKGPQMPSGGRVQIVGADPLENVWRGIEGALLHRIAPHAFALDDHSRQYRTFSVMRTMEECLEQRGIRTRGMGNSMIVRQALEYRGQGLHTTSDFVNILADVSNKTLRAAYEAAPQTFAPITRRIGVRDFKPINRMQLGEAPALDQVLEHGEFTHGTIAEGKEAYALLTYGRIFGLTRQALINDDLDAFGRLITSFAQSARNKESDLAWATFLQNAAMGDGVALFHATHGNLTTPGTAISVDSLGVARAKMRAQKALDGRTYLNLTARYLIVPPGKETLADQYTTQTTPNQSSLVNPFAGRLTTISEPRLEGGVILGDVVVPGSLLAWYMAASLDQPVDLLEMAYLDGEEGPQVETRAGFEMDGVQTKCRLDLGVKPIDWRGFVKNDGA